MTTTPIAPTLAAAKTAPASSSNSAVAALAFAATATAADPRAAYIQQFKDADPNGLYWTPASTDYSFEPQTYTADQYKAFIADQVARTGTTGFSQKSSGVLQYTNGLTQNVAVLYGPAAGGIAEPAGIKIVKPGQTVELPFPNGAVASAQLPRVGSDVNEVAVAAIGYAPFTHTVQGASPNIFNSVVQNVSKALTGTVRAVVNVAIQAVQAAKTVVNAAINLVSNVIRALTPTSTPVADTEQAPGTVGALYERLRATTGDADADGVHVDRVIGANDGETRYIVYLGGTIPLSFSPDQQNLIRNGDAYIGNLKDNQLRAINKALDGHANAKIMLVGYSQGGLDAQNIAASGNYNVTTVITYGSPITKAPPGGYRIIHIEAAGDPIVGLSNPVEYLNNVNRGNVYQTTASTFPGPLQLLLTRPWDLPNVLVKQVHANRATYVEVGNKFEKASGFGDVKSNIANFRGKLDYSFN